MTAIISYFDKKMKIVIVGCDSMSYGYGKNTKCDKGYLLFNRYFIATYGADLLSDSIINFKQMESYQNFKPPESLEIFYDRLFKMYEKTVAAYKKDASPAYKDPLKRVAALVYDEHTNRFEYVDFGHPFNEKYKLCFENTDIEEGIQKYALFEGNDPCDEIDISEFLKDPKEIINTQFSELNNYLSITLKKEEDKELLQVGELGTFYDFRKQWRILESTFSNIDEIIPLIEYRDCKNATQRITTT